MVVVGMGGTMLSLILMSLIMAAVETDLSPSEEEPTH